MTNRIRFAALTALSTVGIAVAAVVAHAPPPAPVPPVVAAVPKPKPAAPAPTPQPVAAAYVIKRVLPIDGPMKFGEHHWDEADVPAGPLVVTVDLKAQTMSVFRDGYEIGAAVILYGSDEKPTPTGVYPITQKKRHHVSTIYGAPMPYMQRLTNDGVSIHASDVAVGYATHGCIGIPTEFARKLFEATKVGDRVIVTNGEMLDVGQAITAA